MTAAAAVESRPARQTLWRGLLACAAPALILLAIVAPFLRYHGYSMLLPESLALVAGAVAVGLAIGLVSRLRPTTLGPALIAVVLCVFIFHRSEVSDRLVPLAGGIAEYVGNLGAAFGLIIVAAFLAVLSVCVLLQRHLNAIVAAAFGTVVLSSLLLPPATGGKAVETGVLPTALGDLPPVVHIVLDEHIGIAGLPAEMEESAGAQAVIRATYEDFVLYPRAYSRFAETQFSLASLMNGDRQADVTPLLERKWPGYTLRKNDWFDRLQQAGYAVRVYQTDYLDMCSESAAVDACHTYSLHSLNAIQRSALSSGERLRLLLAKMNFFATVPLPGPLAATEVVKRFEADIAAAPRGVAYVLHLLLPHEGFLYSEDCEVTDPAGWQGAERLAGLTAEARTTMYRLYLAQLVCTERQVAGLFDRMKAIGVYDDATIIVHGDHGSRIGEKPWMAETPAELSAQDLLDHFSTLLAVKKPGGKSSVDDTPVVVQQKFAEMFLPAAEMASASAAVFVRSGEDSFGTRILVWPQDVAAPPAGRTNLASQLGLRRFDESFGY